MHSFPLLAAIGAWGKPVQKPLRLCGLRPGHPGGIKKCVHKSTLLHTFMNKFSTQSYTGYFSFSICSMALLHTFHTTYNNHSIFKETNL